MMNNIYIFIIILILIIYYLITKNDNIINKTPLKVTDVFSNTQMDDKNTMSIKHFIKTTSDKLIQKDIDNLKKCNSSIEMARFEKDDINIKKYTIEIQNLENEINSKKELIKQYEYKISILNVSDTTMNTENIDSYNN